MKLKWYFLDFVGRCLEWKGIQHPYLLNICCARECGVEFCGTSSCRDGPGGAGACCGLSINIPCEFRGIAPCRIGKRYS